MDNYAVWIGSSVALVFGAGLGILLHMEWQRRVNLSKRRIPKQWPIAVRALVNSRERRVWRWLVRSFMDHHVMIKIPVTRFTLPMSLKQGEHWFELLSGVYCTLTVCTADGKVLGCVDVPGPRGLSLGNQTLKHTLLTQCGIRYWVVDPDHLPNPADIRTSFTGELVSPEPARDHDAQFNQTWADLQAIVLRQRHHKRGEASHPEATAPETPPPDSTPLASDWHENSFMAPLDSRQAELR